MRPKLHLASGLRARPAALGTNETLRERALAVKWSFPTGAVPFHSCWGTLQPLRQNPDEGTFRLRLPLLAAAPSLAPRV